jgi:hypothetical protein
MYSFLLRMTDTMTSQNIDLSSWGILYTDIVFRHWEMVLTKHKYNSCNSELPNRLVWRYLVLISAMTSGILTAIRGLPQFLQTNAGIISRIDHEHFLLNHLQFIFYLPSYCPTLDSESVVK